MRDVGALIVHHRHYPHVLETVRAVLASGIPAESVVLVDNSEDDEVEAGLRRSLPDAVRLCVVPNRGYAAAVNAGHGVLATDGAPDIVVVATHEIAPDEGALAALADAVRADPVVGAAGPTLLLRPAPGRPERVWSQGGRLSPVLGWPRHEESADSPRPAPREWLDGALCAYRSAALGELMREDFFMYVEELEFHRRLRSLGWTIMWVPSARATQDTHGAPPYLQARNLQIFYGAWGTRLQRLVSVPLLILRQLCVRALRRQRALPATMAAIEGWSDGRRSLRAAVPTLLVPSEVPKAFRRF